MELKTDYSAIQFARSGKLKLLLIVDIRPKIIWLAAVITKYLQYFDCILAHNGQLERRVFLWPEIKRVGGGVYGCRGGTTYAYTI